MQTLVWLLVLAQEYRDVVFAALAIALAIVVDVCRCEIGRLRQQLAGHCERIARQSDQLSRNAERDLVLPTGGSGTAPPKYKPPQGGTGVVKPRCVRCGL